MAAPDGNIMSLYLLSALKSDLDVPAWCMKQTEIHFDLHSGKNLNQIHTY